MNLFAKLGAITYVADDRVDLTIENDSVMASAPANIRGMIEVRGVGLARLPALERSRVAMVIDLVDDEAVDRLPAPAVCRLLGIDVQCLSLAPHAASSAAKVRIAIDAVGNNMLVAP